MAPLLSVENLNVTLGNKPIIRNLSFTVNAGDSVSIIGPNGSGKTVLLKALLHLIPFTGQLHWGQAVRIGYVPQSVAADRQLPLTTREVFEAKANFLKLPASAVDSVAAEVDLSSDLLDANIGILSGGQFQKLLLGFALLGSPNVLLFDEPTASLDELTEERVYESLHSLQVDRGLTVILVSHDLSLVYRYSNKVLCLSKGKTCMGPPASILTPELLQELYSTHPKYYQHLHNHRRT